MSLPTGTILGQRYELRAFVGSDGTLDVYRGLDLRLGRDVALTVLEILTIHTPEELISFEKEAQVRAGLHHPRIMTVHDFGHGARCAFQVAEWLEGQSLRRRLQRGPLSWKEARDVGEAVIEGLVILLRKGYTLRVLDTTSVFLQYDGQVKLFAYQLRRIEGGDILKAQKEGLQTLAQVLLQALGGGQESLDANLSERILPHLRNWAGRTTLDASTLRREFEHLLQDQPPPVKRASRRRWLPGTALIIAVPVSVALYVQRSKLPPPPSPPPVTGPKPVRDPEAQWLSLQGAALLETLEPDNLNRALTHLQSAITRDPRNATACSSLGKCYGLLGLQRLISREEALRQSRTAIEHALALEPPAGEAHAALAFQRTWYELDWTGAEQEYRRALELAPDQVDILRDFGAFLALRGRWGESLEHFQAALERDPLSRLTRVQMAVCLHWAGRSEEALNQFAKALDQDAASRDTLFSYRDVLEQLGRLEDALQVADRLAALGALSERDASALRTSHELRGPRGYWIERVRQAERGPDGDALSLAELVALQGDPERALRLVARGLREKSLLAARLEHCPALAALRSDPRFRQLLKKAEGPAT
jgi:Tfp pilus assembly protein PilF